MINVALILALCLLLSTGTVSATEWERDFDLTVAPDVRLTARNYQALQSLLRQLPRHLFAHLAIITIDGIGFDPSDPRMVNCASGDGPARESPFPPDVQGLAPLVDRFYGVCGHELGHQLPVAAGGYIPGLEGTRPWLNAWATALIAEAGCDRRHYLRSMFYSCFFRDFPQEFVASLVNQWLADSRAVWRLAVKRFAEGNPHPANQALLLTAWFGTAGEQARGGVASVHAYRYQDGLAIAERWTVRPWRCGGPATIAGADFSLELEVDPNCRVLAVGHAEGL